MSMGTVQKLQYQLDIAVNKNIIVIDPEAEYKELSKVVIEKKDKHINPLY